MEIAYRDEKKAKTGKTFAMFMLLFSIITLNPITFIGTLFCFFVLKESYYFWKHYSLCIKLFYIISLMATVVEIVTCLVLFVYLNSNKQRSTPLEEAQGKQINPRLWNTKAAAILFCLSGLQLILIVKVYRAIFKMYIEFADSSLSDATELFVISPGRTKEKPLSHDCLLVNV